MGFLNFPRSRQFYSLKDIDGIFTFSCYGVVESSQSYLRNGTLCVPLLKLAPQVYQPYSKDTLLFGLSACDIAPDDDWQLVCPAGETTVIVEEVEQREAGYLLYLRIPATSRRLIPLSPWESPALGD